MVATVVVVVVEVVEVVVLQAGWFLVSICNVSGFRRFLHGHVGSLTLEHDSTSVRTSSPSPHSVPSVLLHSLQPYVWSWYGLGHPSSPAEIVTVCHLSYLPGIIDGQETNKISSAGVQS